MKDLPTLTATLTPANWQAKINRMAIDSAHDTLAEIGAEGTIELGFALLQTYYMLAYSASLPWLEDDGTLLARLDTLRKIMESCGLDVETTVAIKKAPSSADNLSR